MRRSLITALALAACVATGAAAQNAVARSASLPGALLSAPATKGARRLVVIDAGHGGTDPGMRGRLPGGKPVYEKDITIGVARKLADALRARGVDVLLTRDRDTLIALHDRGRIANQAKADLFLSIHVNAPGTRWANPNGARGFETFFLDEEKTEDESRVAAMENAAVQFETSAPPPPGNALSFIMNDMAQNQYLRESYELAGIIQNFVAREHPGPNRGVKQANLAVLRYSYMPGVLVETGFASNAAEAAWLTSLQGQRALAATIADATMEYFHQYDRRSGAAQR